MCKKMFVFTLVTLALVYGSIAQANTISGKLWAVADGGPAQNAIPANVPGTTPDVTFDVNSPFNFSGTNVTRTVWLGSSSASNIVENTSGTLAAQMSTDGGGIGTLLEFTGFVTVTNGMVFTVTHDDGLTLIIGGLDLGFNPGPTSPVTSNQTYTGPSGNFAFQLVYAECDAGPAVLQVDLPFTNAPLPGSLLLLGSGILGMMGIGIRRKSS
jgi:hypothetical protein